MYWASLTVKLHIHSACYAAAGREEWLKHIQRDARHGKQAQVVGGVDRFAGTAKTLVLCYNQTMPKRDFLHETVKNALIKDAWTITADPFRISFGIRKVFVDLGAEKSLLAAENGDKKIAVEIKSFIGMSKMNDLENAIGQYIVYRTYLHEIDPERTLYLAIDSETYAEIFYDVSGQILLDVNQIRLIVVEPDREEITQWIN
jgi:hypothetical protein